MHNANIVGGISLSDGAAAYDERNDFPFCKPTLMYCAVTKNDARSDGLMIGLSYGAD